MEKNYAAAWAGDAAPSAMNGPGAQPGGATPAPAHPSSLSSASSAASLAAAPSTAPAAGPSGTDTATTGRTRLIATAVFVALAVAGALLPQVTASALLLTLLTQAVISAILATSVGFLVRQNGLVSFGQAAFYGLAGYVVALSLGRGIAGAELSIVAAIVLPTVLAFGLGLLFLRLVGVAFSMLTLAVAQAFYEVFLRWRELANGEDGMKVALPDMVFGVPVDVFQRPGSMFVICWVILMAVLLGLWLLTRSHFGTLTLAIRENEERVRFIGYATNLPRAIVYATSAAIAALAGVLFAMYNGFMTPETLHWGLSGEVLIMAIIGGTRAVWGPALGAVIFFFLKGAIGDVTEHWPAIIGSLLILVVVLMPSGLSGLPGVLMRRFKDGRGQP